MRKPILIFLFFSAFANAIDIHEFDTEQQRLDYQQLTEELRCLVCQNQNIADYDAGLAKDLRNEVAKMVKQGQNQQQSQVQPQQGQNPPGNKPYMPQ